jgi:WXG100 family type VII secretion target
MAGGYTTGAAELTKAAQQMESTNTQLMNNLKKLSDEVEQVASSWKGQAATAFQTLMSKFSDDAQKLNKDLDTISQAVTGNANAYRQQEDEAAQSVSAIASALGG